MLPSDIEPGTYFTREYDDKLDDARSVILDICKVFSNIKEIEFNVSGFGSAHWPVDCWFDLPTIIEQLREIVKRIRKDDFNFSLDFYEQGIEREIVFRSDKENVILECRSRTDWRPEPSSGAMKKEAIKEVFYTLYDDFQSLSALVCGDLTESKLYKEWKSQDT